MVDADLEDDDVTQQTTTEFSIRSEDLDTIELSDIELDFERALAGVSPKDETGSSSNGSNQTSGSDTEEEERKEGSDKEEKSLGFLGVLGYVVNLFKLCGLYCVIACPPVPEIITRKMAFHPPECTYSAYLRADPAKERIVAARKLQNKDFVLQPTPINDIPQREYDRIMRQCTPFTVTTRQKTVLVGAHFQPSNYPVNSRKDLSAIDKQVIIFAQPNSSDLGQYMHPHSFLNFAALANAMHMDIYAFDYSGYGLSSGYPSERHMYADVHAVYDYVRKERPDKKICLIGHSIGTSAVTDLASLQPPGLSGVILVAPFTSGWRLMWNAPTQERTCCLDRFKSVEKITEVIVPVLIIHGTDDTIKMAHSQELHRRLKHPVRPLFLHGADHMSVFSGTHPKTFRRIYKFLKKESFVDGRQPSSSSKDKTTPTTSESRDD